MAAFRRSFAAARRATRGLVRARGFTAPAIITLAMGIGTGAALLALTDAGLSHPSPIATVSGVDVPGSRGGVQPGVRFSSVDRLLGAGRGLQDAAMSTRELQASSLRELLRTLCAVGVLTIGIAALNLLLVQLMRGVSRRRELAVRSAVGGTRREILRHLGAEGAVLVLAGSALGIIFAAAGVRLLRAYWSPELVPWLEAPVPARAVALAVALLAVTAAAGSLWPAGAIGTRPLQPDLAAGDRSTAAPGEVRLRMRLGGAAVAGSVMLLVAAGVLMRGLSPAAADPDRAFDASDTLTLHLSGYAAAGAATERTARELESLLASVSAVPGVVSGSISSPGAWFGLGTRDIAHALLALPGEPGSLLPPGSMLPTTFHAVGPGYFTAMRTPMTAGRDFASGDRPGAPGVLIVNETFARELLKGVTPIGKKVQLGRASLDGEFYTIVGVVPDVRLPGLGVSPTPHPAAYLSALQAPPSDLSLALRADGDPMSLLPSIQAALASVHPAAVATDPMTMDERITRFGAPIVWFGKLFAAAAALAAALAAHGLHGVISYSVRRRKREIGVRVALGAPPATIVRLIVSESVRLTAAGAAVGLAGALCLARLLEYLFHGVDAQDPVVYGSVVALLVLIAIAASAGPARSAARLQPVTLLREE